MSEHDEQAALIQWIDIYASRYPRLAMLFAIPNGGYRSKRAALRVKAEGVRRGIPDLCLPLPGIYGATLWIEMKTSSGRLSPEQQWWRDQLTVAGHGWRLCRSWTAAAMTICIHVGIRPEECGL